MRGGINTHVFTPFAGRFYALLLAISTLAVMTSPTVGDDHPWGTIFHKHFGHQHMPPGQIATLNGGSWYWMRSPEQEKTVVMNLYNRYCIRCHGVDGRGVWDIPGIPDFTDVRWQNYRTDPEIVRIIVEGRGAVMPQFRGALALDEAWGLAHYLRSFVPGSEMSRPELRNPPGQGQANNGQASAAATQDSSARSPSAARGTLDALPIPPASSSSSSSPFAR
jgi:hypothetical protein